MKTFLIVAGLLYGAYWYADSRYDFHDTFTYAKTHEYHPQSQRTMYYVGLVYYQRAEFEKSKEVLGTLVNDYSTGTYVAPALFRLSEVAQETRDWPLARQSLERFISEYPNDKKINMAVQRLEIVKFK